MRIAYGTISYKAIFIMQSYIYAISNQTKKLYEPVGAGHPED